MILADWELGFRCWGCNHPRHDHKGTRWQGGCRKCNCQAFQPLPRIICAGCGPDSGIVEVEKVWQQSNLDSLFLGHDRLTLDPQYTGDMDNAPAGVDPFYECRKCGRRLYGCDGLTAPDMTTEELDEQADDFQRATLCNIIEEDRP